VTDFYLLGKDANAPEPIVEADVNEPVANVKLGAPVEAQF